MYWMSLGIDYEAYVDILDAHQLSICDVDQEDGCGVTGIFWLVPSWLKGTVLHHVGEVREGDVLHKKCVAWWHKVNIA